MLDYDSIERLIEQEIKSTVDSRVHELLGNGAWLNDLETQIVRFVQDRVTAKFSNVSAVPDLIEAMKSSMRMLLQQEKLPGVEQYIDHDVIDRAVDHSIQSLVTQSIQNLTIDQIWIDKIEKLINVNMTQKLMERLSVIDVTGVIAQTVNHNMHTWKQQLKQNFETVGILDQSFRRELTVMDGAVVVESDLFSRSLSVEQDAMIKGACVVNDLVVKGSINTDNHSWQELARSIAADTMSEIDDVWSKKITNQVLEIAREQGIEFAEVKVNGKHVLMDNALGNGITESNLETLGRLRNLTVTGTVNLHNDTLSVLSRRIGINTRDPEMALTVWDEEVCVLAGKISQDFAYLGTGRRQALALGVNRKNHVVIDVDGLVTVQQLRIDRWKIGHAAQVPGYSGTRGDFLLNHDPKPESPFAWICLGGFKWQPLRSA